MAATAADIPIELYDLILSFFRHPAFTVNLDARWRHNVVLANKRELGRLALVCRRWAPLCQPRIFHEVALRNRDDIESLLALLADPKCQIAHYIHEIDLSHSVSMCPYLPWIHIVLVRLIPKLRQFWRIKEMTVTGPLPVGQSLRSIHGVLPRRYPQFAAGIDKIVLKDLHLKSFGHLVQLLKELPSLREVLCINVTWDSSLGVSLPVATSYLGRNVGTQVKYLMGGCTDNAAAGWLTWLLALSQPWRLEQQDSDALCRIASDICKDAARFPNWTVSSYRYEDCFNFWAWGHENFNRWTPFVKVYLTSAVPGERQRRVRAVHLDFRGLDVSSVVGRDCWPAIDAQLATLPSLRTVLIQAWNHDELAFLASAVVNLKMPALRDSTRLEYAHDSNHGHLWYTHGTVESEDKGRQVEDTNDIL